MYVNKHAWSNSHINQIKSAEQNTEEMRGISIMKRGSTGEEAPALKRFRAWQIELENCSTDLFIARSWFIPQSNRMQTFNLLKQLLNESVLSDSSHFQDLNLSSRQCYIQIIQIMLFYTTH